MSEKTVSEAPEKLDLVRAKALELAVQQLGSEASDTTLIKAIRFEYYLRTGNVREPRS